MTKEKATRICKHTRGVSPLEVKPNVWYVICNKTKQIICK